MRRGREARGAAPAQVPSVGEEVKVKAADVAQTIQLAATVVFPTRPIVASMMIAITPSAHGDQIKSEPGSMHMKPGRVASVASIAAWTASGHAAPSAIAATRQVARTSGFPEAARYLRR